MDGTAAASVASVVAEGEKHALTNKWTYWELRKGDPVQRLPSAKTEWKELLLPLFEFDTVEDFALCWKKVPNITLVFDHPKQEAHQIERDDERAAFNGKTLRTKADGYMLFKQGIEPRTEFKIPGTDERWCKSRRRCELAVRAEEFADWWKAWEATVLALIGEQIDPANYLIGAYLTDKHSKASVVLRLELWFSTDDAVICEAISQELAYLLKESLPSKAFRFLLPERDNRGGAGANAPAPAAGGGWAGGGGGGGGWGGGGGGGGGGGWGGGGGRPRKTYN